MKFHLLRFSQYCCEISIIITQQRKVKKKKIYIYIYIYIYKISKKKSHFTIDICIGQTNFGP